jgi:AraC-like DNA-binding protein
MRWPAMCLSSAAWKRRVPVSGPGAASVRSSEVARYLAVEHAAGAHAAAVFEHEGAIPIPQLARHLGCSQRTLERRLREEGLTAELLRSAVRLLRATERLRHGGSLTEVAVDEGFSDLAHMSRSFQASCGMSPTLLRRIFAGLPG